MFFNSFVAVLAFFVPIATIFAQVPEVSISVASFEPLCAATGLCIQSGGGTLLLADFFGNIVIHSIKIVFVGVAVAFLASYSVEMIIGGSEESVLTEKRRAFGYAATGMAIAGLASFIASAFAPSVVGPAVIVAPPFEAAAEIVVNFITIAAGVFLVFVIGMSGFRIIVLQGNEGEIDKQRKNFLNGLFGIVILFLSRVIVLAILPGGGPSLLVTEIGGMIKFVLGIVATLSIVGFMVGGLLMIVSLQNDNLRQRGRRIILSTILILILVIFSHTLVSTFIP